MKAWHLIVLLAAAGVAWAQADHPTELALSRQDGLEISRLNDNPFDEAIQFRTATCSDRVLECVAQNRDGQEIDRFFYGPLKAGSH